MNMEHQTEYLYKAVDLLDDNIDLLANIEPSFVKMVCYHVNTEGKFPFIQFLLSNNNGIPFLGNIFQEMDFPTLDLTTIDDNNIQINIKEKVVKLILNVFCNVDELDDIVIKGHCNFLNTHYLFIDISKVNITPIYLKKSTPAWFVLTNEIINNRNVCNIPISQNVYKFFVSDYNLFTLTDLAGNCFRSPDVVYYGSYFKQTEFQSIFGISKSSNDKYCSLLYSIQDAFKNGGWTISGAPESKFNKNITDNEVGRYISGGINRFALLSTSILAISGEDIDDFVSSEEYDCITTVLNNQPVALTKGLNNYVSLSYHRIDKKYMGKSWDPNNCYCIE